MNYDDSGANLSIERLGDIGEPQDNVTILQSCQGHPFCKPQITPLGVVRPPNCVWCNRFYILPNGDVVLKGPGRA